MGAFRILIVDDHDAVRRGVRSLLSTRSEWAICGEATDGIEAVEKAKELRPDLVLMDVSMPRLNGIEATRIIRRELPECEVIIVSQNDPTVLGRQVSEVGARNYVVKADMAYALLPTLEKTFAGKNGKGNSHGIRESVPPTSLQSLFGGGKLGQLIREYDWSKTPLGPIEDWPQSLQTAVNLMLNSQHPMWIGWGHEMIFLYNDAYISVLSQAKHPWALGKPAREVWSEIWDVCGPLSEKVFNKGEPSFFDDVRLFMNRGDYLEETYYSFSYSPIYNGVGTVVGLFCPSAETTAKVLNARRLETLSELSAKALIEKSVEAACSSALTTLGQNPDDVPFAFLYLLAPDGKSAELQGTNRVPTQWQHTAPSEIVLKRGNQIAEFWRMDEVVETFQAQVVSVKELKSLPLGPASQAVNEAIVLPVMSRGQDRSLAVLIAGINPSRPLDVEYRTFFTLVADQMATAIQNARAAEEEKKRIDALAEIDRAKIVFFSNVSHEFRTPLTLMLGPLEDALAESSALSSEHRERLEVAHRNSVRLLKLVNTLLDFSRMESGRTQGTFSPVDLATYTAELGSVFRSVVERAGLRFTVDCPALDEPVYVDREMWEKIVFNLLSNAFKFTFEGEIEVGLRQSGNSAELRVRDTGTGIPPEEIPHLFERFHRVKGAQGRSFEGSGIGLALVQELVKMHGGDVRVQSTPGRGSTFFVNVPLGIEHLPKDHVETKRTAIKSGIRAQEYLEEALQWVSISDFLPGNSPEKPMEEDATPRRHRVILADDNSDMRNYVRKLLSSSYDVEAVTDGNAALDAVRRQPPDIVLTDIMMPGLDGFGLLKALRAEKTTATIPVILLSARAGEESRVEGLAAGADDYLVKPFSARELIARVDTHVKLAHLRRDAERRVRHSEEELLILQRVGSTLASELDLKKIVQTATDAGRELSEADFGAFFYNITDRDGEKYLPYTLSGAPAEALEHLGLPRNTAIFASTFAGEQTVRLHDVLEDPRYGQSAPFHGMPLGHLPVRSYLAVPVISRSGEVIGGMFYGHHEAGIFTERAERLVEGIAKQAAIGIDNARLYGTAQQARAEAQTNAERLRAIFDSAAVGVTVLSLDTHFLQVNDAFCSLTGYSEQEIKTRDCYSLTHPDDIDAMRQSTQQLIEGKIPTFTLEERYLCKSGETIWVQKSVSLIRDSAGKPEHIIALCQEITRRKQAEQASNLVAAIVDSSDDAIVSKNLDGIITSWNKSAERIFGYTAQEAIGQHITLIIPLDRRQEEVTIIERLRRGERIDHFDTVRRRKDGTFLDVSLTISPVKDSSGKVVGASKVARDVTERKRTEENYRKLAESLDAEVRARTKELEERNTDVLRQSEQLRELSSRLMRIQDEERRRFARELHDSAGQTLTVLGMSLAQVADAAKRSDPALTPQVNECQEFVQQLMREIRTMSYLLHPPLLDESGLAAALSWYIRGLEERSVLEIRLDVPEDFGRLPGDMELALFRLIQECLTNVHRHSGTKTASIRLTRNGGQVCLEVHDEGKGISSERLAAIQSHASGVGIRGMRERVRHFHGELIIASDDHGTTIKVTLPIATQSGRNVPLEAAV